MTDRVPNPDRVPLPETGAKTVEAPPGYKTIVVPYGEREATTTTVTTSTGFDAFLPTLLPALQSGSYVLVIIAGFVLWSSRKTMSNFIDKHIALMETVKDGLDKQIESNNVQMEVLKQLSENNSRLIDTVQAHGLNTPNLKTTRETMEITQ